MADGLPDSLKATYDVIGFDPRGVGGSSPSLTCDADYFAPVRPDYVPVTKSLENDLAEQGRRVRQGVRAEVRLAAPAHEDHGRRPGHGRHPGRAGPEADQLLRRVLRHLPGFGVRHAVPHARAPHGAGQQRQARATSGTTPTSSRTRRSRSNLNALFAWIAKYDSIYHLGTTQAGGAFVLLEHAQAAGQDARRSGIVGGDELIDTYLVAGYIDLGAYWPYLANALAQYKAGNAQPLVDAYNLLGATPDDNGYAVYNAVQCSDVQWPTSWNKWRADNWKLFHAQGNQIETWGNAWYNAPCLTWPAKAGKPVDVGHAKGIPPVLLFQATNDAATPFPGGVEMNQRLKGSRLVIEDGGRTHGVVERGNACIDDKFAAFLTDGTLPANRVALRAPAGAGSAVFRVGDREGGRRAAVPAGARAPVGH